MLLYKGIFELSIFSFFLLSKEVLFYGEERLITVCYLFLFFVGFFNLYQGVINDFNERSNSIKEELDSYYFNIIQTIVNTKKFIKQSVEIFNNLLVLYKSLISEFNFYFLFFSNNSNFKKFILNYKANNVLSNANNFFWNVKHSLIKHHTTTFFLNEIASEQYGVSNKVNKANELIALINKQIELKKVN